MKDTVSHRMAFFHMMGQMEDMGAYRLTTSDVARLMGVSKPTALKRLRGMVKGGSLLQFTEEHRSNANAYFWALTLQRRRMYDNGHFKPAYEQWKDEAFGSGKNDR